MYELLNGNDAVKTMSSLEIAKITGKNHKHVLRDIRTILEEAEIDETKFGSVYLAGNGEKRICYILPRLECDLIVSGYSTKYRLAIIKKWHELEMAQPQKTPLQLAKEQVVLWEIIEDKQRQLEIAIQTKAEIGTRREATAMNTASQETKRANKLKIELDTSKEYATIKKVNRLMDANYGWKLLREASTALELPIEKASDANYGSVNSYNKEAWLRAYGVDITVL